MQPPEQLDAIAEGYIVDVVENNPKFDRRYAVVNDESGNTVLFINDLGYAEKLKIMIGPSGEASSNALVSQW